MNDVLSVLWACLLGAVTLAPLGSRIDATEWRWLRISIFAHVAAAMANVWIIVGVYGSGDMVYYFDQGRVLADWLEQDPSTAWEVLFGLLFQSDESLTRFFYGAGGSTGTMYALSALLQLLVGSSLYGVNVGCAAIAFWGKTCAYLALRDTFTRAARPGLLVACFVLPSAVYWTSGLAKESFASAGLGFMLLGLHRVLGGRWSGLFTLALGAGLTAMTKAYVLMSFIAGGAGWLWSERARRAQKPLASPIWLLVATGAAVLGILAIGEAWPKFAIGTALDRAALIREGSTYAPGGSDLDVSTFERSNYVVAPVALFNALLRPTLLDVKNPLMLISALETTVLFLLLLRLARRVGVRELLRDIVASPGLTFSLILIVFMGLGVGMSTINLGTLVRYRAPLLPFFAVLVLVPGARNRPERARTVPARPGFRPLYPLPAPR